jgi:16S rRNA U516 pseudouridylate synthase RsuA-like enzyme
MRKHLRDCRRLCESVGLEVMRIEHRRSGHIALHTDKGYLFFGATPSDRRWRMNMLIHARRLAAN